MDTAIEEEKQEGPSVADSILQSIQELQGEGDNEETSLEADALNDGQPSKEAEKPVEKKDGKSSISEAARTLAQSRKRGKDKQGAAEQTQPNQAENQQPLEGEQQKDLPPLSPPQRFPVHLKEWFHKQPRQVQEEAARGFADLERKSTQLWQELNREKGRYQELDRIVSHYLPKWNIQGMTDTQVVAQLCAAQERIQNDPVGGCFDLMQSAGVTLEQLQQYQGGNGVVQQQPQQQANNFLTKDDLESYLRTQQQQAAYQQEVQQAAQQVAQVKNERSGDGRYLWPELWDDSQVERVKPLVEGLRKTHPQMSWGDAAKQAVLFLRGTPNTNGSPSATSPRLPSKAEEAERIRRGSVSIRGNNGRIAPTSRKAAPGESVTDSIKNALAELEGR